MTDGWVLACAVEGCDMVWSDDRRSTVDAMELHFSVAHPDSKNADGATKIDLKTVWRGKGPEPLPQTNRAARRRQKKRKGRRP